MVIMIINAHLYQYSNTLINIQESSHDVTAHSFACILINFAFLESLTGIHIHTHNVINCASRCKQLDAIIRRPNDHRRLVFERLPKDGLCETVNGFVLFFTCTLRPLNIGCALNSIFCRSLLISFCFSIALSFAICSCLASASASRACVCSSNSARCSARVVVPSSGAFACKNASYSVNSNLCFPIGIRNPKYRCEFFF